VTRTEEKQQRMSIHCSEPRIKTS